jgi:hypothetical protein
MRSWLNGTRPLALALIVLALPGCASRTVPTQFPTSSAASPAAPQPAAAVVTGSLTEEPPLPGQPATQWPGLQVGQGEPQASAHGGHHGH